MNHGNLDFGMHAHINSTRKIKILLNNTVEGWRVEYSSPVAGNFGNTKHTDKVTYRGYGYPIKKYEEQMLLLNIGSRFKICDNKQTK